jgi:hypothetical protein
MPPSTCRPSTSLEYQLLSCLSLVSLVSLSCPSLASLSSLACRVPHLNPNRNSECVARGPRQAPIILYMRLTDSCITQLKAQGPVRTCNESKEEEEEAHCMPLSHSSSPVTWDCLMRNCPPPWDHRRALGIGLLKGARLRWFLMSEVPLYGITNLNPPSTRRCRVRS